MISLDTRTERQRVADICGAVCRWAMPYFIAVFVFGLLVGFFQAYDNSDAPGKRSGMSIHTDHLTGCQYLYRDGLTPRLNADGSQIGCR